jgi:mono/diheme cytochrome c family protein
MTHRPDSRFTRISRVAGGAVVAVFTGVSVAACQRAAEAEFARDGSYQTTTTADTPVVADQPKKQEAGGQQDAEPAAPGAAAPSPGGDLYDGWKMYAVTCERCHGQDALGSALAPDLRKSAATLGRDGFVQVVVNGRIEKGMPAFKDVLEPQQIENVYAYVAARGSGELGAGRPAQ